METIFFLSAHWGNGPIFAAGSVLVKSGLGGQGVSFLQNIHLAPLILDR